MRSAGIKSFFLPVLTGRSDFLLSLPYNNCYFSQNKLYLYEIAIIMGRKATSLLPRQERMLEEVGENLRLARLRRRLSARQVADRAGISRSTMQSLEKGASGTSIGNLLQVLVVLGLETGFVELAADDRLGRKLEDARLGSRKRAPKRSKS